MGQFSPKLHVQKGSSRVLHQPVFLSGMIYGRRRQIISFCQGARAFDEKTDGQTDVDSNSVI